MNVRNELGFIERKVFVLNINDLLFLLKRKFVSLKFLSLHYRLNLKINDVIVARVHACLCVLALLCVSFELELQAYRVFDLDTA